MNIAILNYNIGNLASVQNALCFASNQSTQTIKISIESNPTNIARYDKIILPGVGAFGDAMQNLRTLGFEEAINNFVKSGKWLLGICLGAQMLFEKSVEFGEHKGLGFLRGEVVGFDKVKLNALKVPHIGWNECLLTKEGYNNPLLKDLPHTDSKTKTQGFYLYFVHSFHAKCKDTSDILAKCVYGYEFPAIVGKQNVLGIQPHPEKSHNVGLKILQNFIDL